ncbi:MAG: hypothetical protein IPM54_15680 [Polyangiaceae bacterium]|nr:hypothetical protein [Polyangiaceae bacterium]
MAARVRVSFGIAAVAVVSALGVLGCDAGGLIVVENKGDQTPRRDPASTDMVSGGTVVKNSKYKLVYTMGQPTPQSRVTGGEKTLNGGVVGATQGP